jgi:hypothetical protein
MPRRRLQPFPQIPDVGGVLITPGRGDQWFVDTQHGANTNSGESWAAALSTMNEALSRAQTNDVVYFVGDVREEVTGSNLKFDITIVGCGGKHHADQPDSTYNTNRGYPVGSSVWRPPAAPTTATPLLALRGRGWKFVNILFDCPVDAAAVRLERNALSGLSEYDPSHAQFIKCDFRAGLYGIHDDGGCFNVLVDDCDFYALSESGGAGIITTSTSVAVPLRWTVQNSRFIDNVNHIKVSASRWTVKNNSFMKHTTDAINLKAVSSQGEYNWVVNNALSGTYSISGGYTPGSNDEWAGNWNVLSGGVTAADPA